MTAIKLHAHNLILSALNIDTIALRAVIAHPLNSGESEGRGIGGRGFSENCRTFRAN